MKHADLTLVVPAYNERDNVRPFLGELRRALEGRQEAVEVLFVDDGGSDGTWGEVVAAARSWDDRRVAVRGLSLSRNFGKEAAMLAGLEAARGDCLCIIDADLQQPPAVALKMYDLLMASPDYDCVAAFQRERRRGGPTGALSSAFYRLLGSASGMEVLPDASDFRVFRRCVADAIVSLPEYHRFSKGLFAWVGFRTLPFPYVPEERRTGSSTWGFRALVSYAWEGIVSFSTAPLRAVLAFGVVCAALALVMLLVTVIKRVALGVDTPGYATIVTLILFFGGAQLVAIGLVGEYVARTYVQSKRRPVYLVRDRVSSDGDGAEGGEA